MINAKFFVFSVYFCCMCRKSVTIGSDPSRAAPPSGPGSSGSSFWSGASACPTWGPPTVVKFLPQFRGSSRIFAQKKQVPPGSTKPQTVAAILGALLGQLSSCMFVGVCFGVAVVDTHAGRKETADFGVHQL